MARVRAGGWRLAVVPAVAALFGACGRGGAPVGIRPDPVSQGPPRASLVFLVHGDADYTYHDGEGAVHASDEEVVAAARGLATRQSDLEVTVFHAIERRHFLFLIPRKDGRAYHYRHGRLVAEESYWRDQGDRFDPEVRLQRRFTAGGPRPPVRVLLYFGHEIPEVPRPGYDRSYGDRPLDVLELAEGVRRLAGEGGRFDLLVLGTCHGGTPYTIGALAPHAGHIVASPDDLHLSSFDLEPLEEIPSEAADIPDFAHRFAAHAFEDLASEVQTAVSVVLYDGEAVGPYVRSVHDAYGRLLAAGSPGAPGPERHCDCAELPAFDRPGRGRGVTVLWRPARFGRESGKERHSGWECLDVPRP